MDRQSSAPCCCGQGLTSLPKKPIRLVRRAHVVGSLLGRDMECHRTHPALSQQPVAEGQIPIHWNSSTVSSRLQVGRALTPVKGFRSVRLIRLRPEGVITDRPADQQLVSWTTLLQRHVFLGGEAAFQRCSPMLRYETLAGRAVQWVGTSAFMAQIAYGGTRMVNTSDGEFSHQVGRRAEKSGVKYRGLGPVVRPST